MVTSVSSNSLKEIVGKHFPEFSLKSEQRLVGGVSADVFKLELEQPGLIKSVVLRIHGETHGGHDAQLEFDILKSLYDLGVRLPKPLAVDVSLEIVAYPFLLIDFVEGTTKVAPDFANDAIKKMANMLFEIHGHPGVASLPTRMDPLENLGEYLPQEEEFRDLPELVSQLTTQFEGEQVLLHGDYWPENVMWLDGEIAAVLDWEDSAVGDPISDVACCYLELRYIHGQAGADQFLMEYGKYAEINPKRLLLWQLHVSSAAQKYMGNWGLPEEKEAHMRATALEVIRESSQALKALN